MGTANSLVTYPIVGTTYRGELPMQADMWIWIIVPKQWRWQGDASTPCIRTNSGELIPCFTDGLCDCKHNRHGRCLGRMTSPVKKIDLDYLAQTMTMAGGCFNPMHQNERWGIDPLLYRRPVRLQTRQARTLFGAYDKPSEKNRSGLSCPNKTLFGAHDKPSEKMMWWRRGSRIPCSAGSRLWGIWDGLYWDGIRGYWKGLFVFVFLLFFYIKTDTRPLTIPNVVWKVHTKSEYKDYSNCLTK